MLSLNYNKNIFFKVTQLLIFARNMDSILTPIRTINLISVAICHCINYKYIRHQLINEIERYIMSINCY